MTGSKQRQTASQPPDEHMTSTIEISQEVRAWVGNFDMLQALSGNVPDPVRQLRQDAIRAFERLGFPTTKHEEWKYTSLRALSTGEWMPAFRPASLAVEAGAFYAKVLPAGLQGPLLVLVDGHYDAALSRLEGADVTVGSLKAAIEAGNPAVTRHLGSAAAFEDRAIVALNTAIAQDGAFIHISKKTQSSAPITVLHLSVGPDAAANSRTLVLADEQSEAQVVEVWHRWGTGPGWENHVSEVFVGQGASLELVTVQDALGEGHAVTNFVQVLQGQDSTFRATTMSSAGKLVRNDLQVRHLGTGCSTYLNGLTLLDGESHVDHHTLVDHAMPHCYSNETYKTVLGGRSTGVFNGKVMVRPDAQKTNAFQSNKTLLLSDAATVYAKPQLEIFADDVKCSHGATTGRLDETSLFYLRSRGLSTAKARALLTYAFGAEVLEQVGIPALRQHLEDNLMDRLAR